MSRTTLFLKALLFRTLQQIYTFLDLYLSRPLPQRVSYTRKIPTTISPIPGSINLLFYTPRSYSTHPAPKKASVRPSPTPTKKHPLLINFRGGGFTIGHAHDDARWFTAVTSSTSAVVCSVNYRLAPRFPFPTGIEDCVSAILWLWKHADELNLDISRTALSGFSAGGNFCYTVSIRLHEELEKMRKEGKMEGIEEGKIVSLIVFYGSVDNHLTRADRDASNPDLIPSIPHVLFRLFDESYLYPRPDMRSPLLSPGIASDEVLKSALPGNLVLISCRGDQLLKETERFRERLGRLGKRVGGYVVEGVGHGWDKKPTFGKGDAKRDEAYGVAVKSLQEVWS
jgi:acetyl esterase/lipase